MKPLKNSKDLVMELLRREGGKKQVNVAQMTEIVSCLADISFEQTQRGLRGGQFLDVIIYNLGSRRARRKR